MRDRNWDRFGAVAGILVVAIFVVAFFIPGSPPKPDDADRVFRRFVLDNRSALLTQAWLFGIGSMLFVWFGGAVRSVLRRAEGDTGHLANVFFGAIVIAGGLTLVAAAVQTGLVNKTAQKLNAHLVRFAVDIGAGAIAMLGFTIALGGAMFLLVVLATNVLPRWTAALAALAVISNLVGTFTVYNKTGAFSLEGVFGVVPFGLGMLWILGTAVAILRRPAEAPERPPARAARAAA